MKKIIPIFIINLLFVGCHQKISPADLSKINGYWEIEKVISTDGTKKEYTVNENIDYFEIKNNTGFRKKVTPQLDGRYLVNNQSENIKISENDGKIFIHYSTPYAKWKEEIITINKDKLILKNEQNVEYDYKRQIPFSLK